MPEVLSRLLCHARMKIKINIITKMVAQTASPITSFIRQESNVPKEASIFIF